MYIYIHTKLLDNISQNYCNYYNISSSSLKTFPSQGHPHREISSLGFIVICMQLNSLHDMAYYNNKFNKIFLKWKSVNNYVVCYIKIEISTVSKYTKNIIIYLLIFDHWLSILLRVKFYPARALDSRSLCCRCLVPLCRAFKVSRCTHIFFLSIFAWSQVIDSSQL